MAESSAAHGKIGVPPVPPPGRISAEYRGLCRKYRLDLGKAAGPCGPYLMIAGRRPRDVPHTPLSPRYSIQHQLAAHPRTAAGLASAFGTTFSWVLAFVGVMLIPVLFLPGARDAELPSS